MQELIETFLSDKKLAIVGVSPRKENWGKALMDELEKTEYKVLPVNPKYEEIEGEKCYPSVAELPGEIENVIIAVNPELAENIIDQFEGSSIKRVWFQRGMGKGSYSEKAAGKLKENGVEVIYGFCPMMFIGGGFHKFHFWLRKNLGKTPEGYRV